jgi:hypothetical protein
MEFIDQRIFQLLKRPEDFTEMRTQMEALRYTLLSVIQDVTVMQDMLERKGAWDPALYRELRTQRMIQDHSSAGIFPSLGFSAYCYTLDESDFLQKLFHATPAEVGAFEKKVAEVETYT